MLNNQVVYTEEVILLRDLFSVKEEVQIYHFHEEYQLSPGQLLRVIKKYEQAGIIEFNVEKLTIKMTEEGRKSVFEKRKGIFFNRQEYWKAKVRIKSKNKFLSKMYLPDS